MRPRDAFYQWGGRLKSVLSWIVECASLSPDFFSFVGTSLQIPLSTWIVPVEDLEAAAGMQFFTSFLTPCRLATTPQEKIYLYYIPVKSFDCGSGCSVLYCAHALFIGGLGECAQNWMGKEFCILLDFLLPCWDWLSSTTCEDERW